VPATLVQQHINVATYFTMAVILFASDNSMS